MTDRPDIPEEAERFSFEGYERYRVHPDGEWVRYSDYSDALMRAFHAIEGECEKARKQGAEEERERLHSKLRKLALKYGEPTRYELLEVARSLEGTEEESDDG